MGDKRPPDFQNNSKKLIHIDSECCGVADKIWGYGEYGRAFEPRTNFFLFFNSKIFYDIIQNFRLPTVARPI